MQRSFVPLLLLPLMIPISPILLILGTLEKILHPPKPGGAGVFVDSKVQKRKLVQSPGWEPHHP